MGFIAHSSNQWVPYLSVLSLPSMLQTVTTTAPSKSIISRFTRTRYLRSRRGGTRHCSFGRRFFVTATIAKRFIQKPAVEVVTADILRIGELSGVVTHLRGVASLARIQIKTGDYAGELATNSAHVKSTFGSTHLCMAPFIRASSGARVIAIIILATRGPKSLEQPSTRCSQIDLSNPA